MTVREQVLYWDSIGCTLETLSWDFRPLAFDTYAVPSEDIRVLIEDYVTAIMRRFSSPRY